MLRYQYGAFQTQPGINSAIHVSPACRSILDDGAILPRYMRDDPIEGLGGGHEVSVSAYADPERAMATLLYLYRIWQMYHGELTQERIMEMEHSISLEDMKWYMHPKSTHAPHEKVHQLCIEVGKGRCKSPLVFGSDWAAAATRDDFCAIEFLITEQHLFTGCVRGYQSSRNLPFHGFGGFLRAEQYMVPCHSSILKGYPVLNFYSGVEKAVKRGASTVDPYEEAVRWDKHKDRTNTAEHAFFGRDKWDIRRYLQLMRYALDKEGTQFQFDDFSLDFRPRNFAIDNIYEYYLNEQEFRFFHPIEFDRFIATITIDDVIALATQRRIENGGPPIEPLFFHQRPFNPEFILDT
jgi:hypothetical protein